MPAATQLPFVQTHSNDFLFSDYYLANVVRDRAEWRTAATGASTTATPPRSWMSSTRSTSPRCHVGDEHLRRAIDLVARAEDPKTRARQLVDYRDLEIRHLGSIYEGLLEYRLRCAEQDLAVRRVKSREVYAPAAEVGAAPTVRAGRTYLATDKGERKATGSYCGRRRPDRQGDAPC